jgi:hypothetical protein
MMESPSPREIDSTRIHGPSLRCSAPPFCPFVRRLTPAETARLQALRAYPKPASVTEQEFQAVVLRVDEQQDVAAQRLAKQPVSDQGVKFFESLSHVRRARREQSLKRIDVESAPYLNTSTVRQQNGQFTAASNRRVDLDRQQSTGDFSLTLLFAKPPCGKIWSGRYSCTGSRAGSTSKRPFWRNSGSLA